MSYLNPALSGLKAPHTFPLGPQRIPILVNDDKLLKKMVVSATTLGKTSQTNYASLLRSGPDTVS